ncbi:MAG: VOC family protein [Xanthomonadales bacterium]|jgi:predicted enzyme related to lactoylglutathione lyase|nr:VOC family protein [Xanthomonadales bacterium]
MKIQGTARSLAFLLLVLAGIAACSTSSMIRIADVPLSDEPLTGKFVWHDLITDDVDQVKHFYGQLMGWSFEDTTHPNGGDYTLITLGDRLVGGIVQLDDPAGAEYSRWLAYLSVADVDRAVELTESQGGKAVAGPLDLPGIGRAAAIQDPQNAVLGLLRSEHGDPEDSLRSGPGLVAWNELLAENDETAADYYSALAGFKVIGQQREHGVYRVLMSQDQERAGLMQRPADDVEPFWLTHFAVTDVAEATRRVSELGGQVLLAPDAEFRDGLQAVVIDPAGAILALRQWSE